MQEAKNWIQNGLASITTNYPTNNPSEIVDDLFAQYAMNLYSYSDVDAPTLQNKIKSGAALDNIELKIYHRILHDMAFSPACWKVSYYVPAGFATLAEEQDRCNNHMSQFFYVQGATAGWWKRDDTNPWRYTYDTKNVDLGSTASDAEAHVSIDSGEGTDRQHGQFIKCKTYEATDNQGQKWYGCGNDPAGWGDSKHSISIADSAFILPNPHVDYDSCIDGGGTCPGDDTCDLGSLNLDLQSIDGRFARGYPGYSP